MSITKDDARKIASKLGATLTQGGKHAKATVEHDGKVIARFGIRYGSRRNAGHGHIPCALQISPQDTKKLAICTLNRDEYLTILHQRNLL